MLTIFTLPPDIVATTTAYIGSLFTDLLPLICLAIGLPLAFWVIRRVMGVLPRGR